MLNNSGTYGPNEAPPNMISSLNGQQSNASNINHNFNNFVKFGQQTPSSASGYYEPHNFHNFVQPPVNMPPMMHPFQAYLNMEHGSPYTSQNTQFSCDNAVQNYFPVVSTTTQAEYHNNISGFHLSLHNQSPQPQTTTEMESLTTKAYPLNIPQVPSRIFDKSPKINTTLISPENTENSSSLSQNIPQIPTIKSENCTSEEPEDTNVSTSIVDRSGNISVQPTCNDQDNMEIPKNLSQKPIDNVSAVLPATQKTIDNVPAVSPAIQKTTYNIVKNNNFTRSNSSFEKCLSESKRKSLEKTVRLIESILINSSNSKSEIIEDTVDPLAFSPNPDAVSTNSKDNEGLDSDSNDEGAIKKSKNKRKPTKKSVNKTTNEPKATHSENESSMITVSKSLEVKVEDIKVEPGWPDNEDENPFLRDGNGVLRSEVGNVEVIDMENSVNDALEWIKSGSKTKAYMECPHCSLLLLHPKRFLIHTKWHTFGLLNERRAEIMKEREDRVKEKREAKKMERLIATLATGDESGPKFPCKDCVHVFQTKSGLKNHRRKLHPPAVSECRICLAPVDGASELRAHMTSHEAAGLHQCPRCPKRFKYRHSLAKHADTHREKTHSCPECGKLFGSSALVRLHMKTHERAARGASHRCSYCGKGFYEAYNLSVHERTHRNDKPYKCDICESCFVTNSSLKRHVKVSHSGAKPYPCQVCQKCFSSATIRDRHELRAHSDQQQFPYQCRHCPRRYMKTKDLRNHMYKLHPKEKKKDTSDTEHNSS